MVLIEYSKPKLCVYIDDVLPDSNVQTTTVVVLIDKYVSFHR
jgi:hypothetical protein